MEQKAFQELVARYLDGDLSAAEREDFKRLLETHPDDCQGLARSLDTCAWIELAVNDGETFVGSVLRHPRVCAPAGAAPRRAGGSRRSAPLLKRRVAVMRARPAFGWRWAAACIAATLLLALYVIYPRAVSRRASAGEEMGTIVSVSDAAISTEPAAALLPSNAGEERVTLAAGQNLRAGCRIDCGRSAVRVQYAGESSFLEARPGARVQFDLRAGAKIVRLERGELLAAVSKQPPGKPMRFLTRQAEAVVLGTQLRLVAGDAGTRLEVSEGVIELRRIADGASVRVDAGQYAVAAPGVELASQPLAFTPAAPQSEPPLSIRPPAASLPPSSALPAPWQERVFGDTGLAGHTTFADGELTVIGSGPDIWFSEDAFHFIFQPLAGDGQIVARVVHIEALDGWAKSGLMIRESLAVNSRYVFLALTPQHGVGVQFRPETGHWAQSSMTKDLPAQTPLWLKLTRQNNTFRASESTDGATWFEVASCTVELSAQAQCGLAVTAHYRGGKNTSRFDHLSVEPAEPAPAAR